MDVRPMKRICPSVISVSRRKVSRHSVGTRNGSTPSMTSISAKAVRRVLPTAADYFVPAALPPDFRYLKNSELGSTTITSFFLNVLLYASRLR